MLHLGIGVAEDARVRILAEDGLDAFERLSPLAGPVVLEHTLIAPVGDRGEVHVDQAGEQAFLVEGLLHGPEEADIHLPLHPIGIGGKGTGLGQDVEAGKEPQAPVHGPENVLTVPLVSGELESQEGQDALGAVQLGCLWIPGLLDPALHLELDQQREECEQPDAPLGVKRFAHVQIPIQAPGVRGGKVAHGAFSLLHGVSSGKTAESVFHQNAVDEVMGSPVPHGVQRGLDIQDGVILLAKGEDQLLELIPVVLGFSSRPRRDKEGGRLTEPHGLFEVASHGVYGMHGAVKPLGGLFGGKPIDVKGSQDFIAPVDRLAGVEKELCDVVHAL